MTDLTTLIESRKVESDYFTVNSSDVNLATTGSDTLGEFCIDSDQTVEFFLSGLFSPGSVDAYVRRVWLENSNGDELVIDSYSQDPSSTASPPIPNVDRPFNLFYKGTTASGQPETFTIKYEGVTDSSDNPEIIEKNLQWGYKVYSTTYTLEASPNTTCV